MDWGDGSTLICFRSSFSSFISGNKKLRPLPSRISSILSLFWSISKSRKNISINNWTLFNANHSELYTKDGLMCYKKSSEWVWTYQVASSACWSCSAGTDQSATHGPSVWPSAAGTARKAGNGRHSPSDEPNLQCWSGQQRQHELQTVPGRTSPEGLLPQS